jgi:hypothetical protein
MICYRYRTLSLRLMLLAAICMPVAYDISATQAVTTASLPLYFEANHGQADPSVQFLSRGQRKSFLLMPGGRAAMVLAESNLQMSLDERPRTPKPRVSNPFPEH